MPEPLPIPVLGVDGLVVLPPVLEPVDGAVGLVVLPEVDDPELPMPVEPLPALPLRWSRRQVSRWAPVRPMHLLASLDEPELDDDASVDGVVLLPEDDPLTDGEVVLLPDDELLDGAEGAAGEVVLLPDEPDDEPMPVLPLVEPEDWANAAPDSARSAAAVAAVRVFNIMRGISFEGG